MRSDSLNVGDKIRVTMADTEKDVVGGADFTAYSEIVREGTITAISGTGTVYSKERILLFGSDEGWETKVEVLERALPPEPAPGSIVVFRSKKPKFNPKTFRRDILTGTWHILTAANSTSFDMEWREVVSLVDGAEMTVVSP